MMAPNSHDRGPHEDSFSSDHSIPLQDLSEPPDIGRHHEAGSRFLPGRSLTRGRRSETTYERVAEDSPIEGTTAAGTAHRRRQDSDAHDAFPEDPGAFAAAMSSVGLSFEGPPGHPATRSRDDLDTIPLDNYSLQEPAHSLTPSVSYSDTAPLTNIGNIQPISGAAPDRGRQNDRHSAQTVHFPDDGHTGARLGDDLNNLESGLGGRSRGGSNATERGRSLSPSASGAALMRASSMMKSMSQRVVNLSNEPEVVEQSIQREESHKNSRLEEPPSLPSLPDYAHDAPSTPELDGRVKREKSTASKKAWRSLNNPLRGKSLGILSPDNPLRVRLCDILVHPFTEPFILVVIIVQTILLTIESSMPEWHNAGPWGTSVMDYPYFAIFVIYTLELIAKILVSGFIINPAEYSTIDRSIGFRKAVAEKGKNLIAPHRQMSTRRASPAPEHPQASIIRTFTGGLNQLEQQTLADDPLQKRRVRLAHRAFLRHSFNRLDFVAVVAYWVAFFLSVFGVETRAQLFVFRMLSCLRLLRLLALTNGTSVSFAFAPATGRVSRC